MELALKELFDRVVWGDFPQDPPRAWAIQPVLDARPTPCRMMVPTRRNKLAQCSAVAFWVWFVSGAAGTKDVVADTLWLQWNVVIVPFLIFVVWINRPKGGWRDFESIEAAVEFKSVFFKRFHPGRDPTAEDHD
jgi:hypothetical protein